MSPLVILNTALAIIRLGISPIPMGPTPGFLFNAMSQQDNNGDKILGSMYSVHRRLAHSASDWHRALDADLKEVLSLRQALASRPEGPAAPLVLRAHDLITEASIASKMARFVSGGSP